MVAVDHTAGRLPGGEAYARLYDERLPLQDQLVPDATAARFHNFAFLGTPIRVSAQAGKLYRSSFRASDGQGEVSYPVWTLDIMRCSNQAALAEMLPARRIESMEVALLHCDMLCLLTPGLRATFERSTGAIWEHAWERSAGMHVCGFVPVPVVEDILKRCAQLGRVRTPVAQEAPRG